MADSDDSVELSVITSIYNEEVIIAQSLDNLLAALNELPVSWELILVNDGSTDNTLSILQDLTRDNPRVGIVSYSPNRGRGYAMRQGFTASRGRYVVTVEADLNYGNQIIRRLYDELLASNADIVIASPYMEGGSVQNVPFKRALLSRLGNRILRMAVSPPVATVTGMTRGYRGDTIRSLPLEEDGKEIHLEIISRLSMLGCCFREIPATLCWSPSKKGKPQRKSKFHAGRLIQSHLLFGFHEAPILLFGTVGAVTLLSGLILGFYLSYLYWIQNQTIGNRIVLIMTTIFLILSGFSIFLFCFLAYQIKSLKADIFRLHHRLYTLDRNPVKSKD
ncbi:MAG: glycosyltransferase family 2 protein [Sedimentisphaerales bacterium]|nr:glycosyltransferase family 2 protein [Sedimentisphaerales bacterium]